MPLKHTFSRSRKIGDPNFGSTGIELSIEAQCDDELPYQHPEQYAQFVATHFAKADLMLEQESGELLVLETNVNPGLTETSLLPQAADAAGIDFDALIARLLAAAWTR